MEFDAQALTSRRTALAVLRDQMAVFVNAADGAPSSNSQAQAEIRKVPRPESVQTAHSQGVLLVEVVADQLTGFLKTITEPVETIAPWTCIRALLEAAALACWILDPNINVQTRVGRSFALRYEGLNQQAKWARASGRDPKLAYDRIDMVEEIATNLGFEQVRDRNGRRTGIAQRMPAATELIRDMLDEEALYRLLSAIAHGHHWAIQQASFEITSPPALDPVSGVRVARIEKAPLMDGFAYLILRAAVAFTKVGWYQATYFGWDTTELAELLESSFNDFGVADAVRFWRSAERPSTSRPTR